MRMARHHHRAAPARGGGRALPGGAKGALSRAREGVRDHRQFRPPCKQLTLAKRRDIHPRWRFVTGLRATLKKPLKIFIGFRHTVKNTAN